MRELNRQIKSNCKRFPFNNFTYFLTLFSKCFSSFDHSTCSLSVSGRYLALEEIYLPFRAAFPNNSTRRKSYIGGAGQPRTGFSPSVTSSSKELGPAGHLEASSPGYNSDTSDFKCELLPLHSPLLRQSRLVS